MAFYASTPQFQQPYQPIMHSQPITNIHTLPPYANPMAASSSQLYPASAPRQLLPAHAQYGLQSQILQNAQMAPQQSFYNAQPLPQSPVNYLPQPSYQALPQQQQSPTVELPSSTLLPTPSRRNVNHPAGTPQPEGRAQRRPSKPQGEDGTKSFACENCDVAFARKYDLDRHRRIHTLEAPYVCKGCERSYRRSDARKRHWNQEPGCSILHMRNTSPQHHDSSMITAGLQLS